MKLTIMILFALFLTNRTTGETIDSLLVQKSNSGVIQEKTKIIPQNIDYELMYENQKEFNNSLISTVYWSLGSILIVILAIIGSNLFLNFRFNRKLYEELVSKYELKIKNLETKLIESLNNRIREFERDMDKTVRGQIEAFTNIQLDNIKGINDDFKERLNSYSENLKGQIASVKDRFENAQKENKEKIENSYKLLEENYSKQEEKNKLLVESFEKEIEKSKKNLRIEILELESEMWKSKGTLSNTLLCYLQQSINSLEIGYNWKLGYTLPKIIDVLKQIKSISEYNSDLFSELLPKIPNDYSIQKAEIIELIKDFDQEKNK